MTRFVLIATAAALLLLPSAAGAATPASGSTDQAVATGIDQPTALAFLPDGRMLVTSKTGVLTLVDGASQTTLANVPVCTDSEEGLLGIAVDPNFNSNGYVYLYRSKPGAGNNCGAGVAFNQVVRVTVSGGTAGSLTELVPDLELGAGNHNGGGLRIGPDGKLYISIGEVGNPSNSQTIGNCAGKVLRVELNGTSVADNPFVGTLGACTRIYALGLRNPFRFGFDPLTGRLWLGDVGQSTKEEIDIIVPGGNYGWPNCEGIQVGCPGIYVAPVFDYPRTGPGALGKTVIGGTFASFGGTMDYYFADYIFNNLYRVPLNAARDGFAAAPATIVSNADGPVDLVTGPDGAVYYAALNAGEVHRVTSPPTFLPGEGGGGGSADKTAPKQELSFRKRQDIDKLAVSVTVDESAKVTVSGLIGRSGTSKTRRFKSTTRSLKASDKTRIRVKMKRKTLRSVKRSLRHRTKLKAKLTVVATDAAGNFNSKKLSVRLRP